MTILAFIDTETTGLDPRRHEIWELAIKFFDSEDLSEPFNTRHYMFDVDLTQADLIALNIGKYFERHKTLGWGAVDIKGNSYSGRMHKDIAAELTQELQGVHIIGRCLISTLGF